MTDAPAVCSTTFSGTFNGEVVKNVLAFARADAASLSLSDLTAIHGILDDAATTDGSWTNIIENMDAGLNYNEIYSRTWSESAPIELRTTVNLNGTGTSEHDAPPMLSVLVKWTTLIATRKFRGRTYLPGMNTAMIDATDSDRLTSTNRTNIQTACNQFATYWSSHATYRFVVFSRKNADAVTLPYYSAVQAGSVWPLISTQKRRRSSSA